MANLNTSNSSNPEYRSAVVRDALKKSKFYLEPRPLTDEQKTMERAKLIAKNVATQIEALLRGMTSTQQYSSEGTGQLMADLFRPAFNQFSKEELIHLCVVLHVSPMLEWVDEQVAMGLIGSDKDKPI